MAARLALHVLASGSRGNASLVEDAATGACVLVDCGICKRDFFARCEDVGVDPARISDVLITHEHTDHTKGLGVVMRGLGKIGCVPRIHVLSAVSAASADIRALEGLFDVVDMRLEQSVTAGALSAYPFATSHDSAASCGFRFSVEGEPPACGREGAWTENAGACDAIGFLTDSGVVTGEAREALANVRILALEANHDARMLAEGPYPWTVKQRIASDRGHLSNDQAACALADLLSDKLEQIVAMHVSETNNTYRASVDALERALDREGHGARVASAFQSRAVSV